MRAIWLLENHKAHQSRAKLLEAQLRHITNMKIVESDLDEEIEGMALRGNPISGIPHTPNCHSKTERIAMTYNDVIIIEQKKILNIIQSQLNQLNFYLLLYDAVMEGLTEAEKWLVESHYIQQKSYCDLLKNPHAGIKYTSKTGLYNKMLVTLQKIDVCLATINMQKMNGDTCICLSHDQNSLTG